jgi:hypothetical protein
MNVKSLRGMLLVSGYATLASLSTMVVLQPEPFTGDFTTSKTREYFAPVNSKTIGACVNIKETRNYTAMPIKYQGIEQFFV